MRFFFDAGSGTVLWGDLGPADLDELPISASLRAELSPEWEVENGFSELHEDPERA